MRSCFLGIILWVYIISGWTNTTDCVSQITGYKLVKNSIFPFKIGDDNACFFAFFTPNPDPAVGSRGDGNLGDSLWYGYYKKSNPFKIYEFPKPDSTDWSSVCSINAVSFYPMHGDKKPDVTVIGSCNKQNAINYTIPFVFIWQGDKFILDKKVYLNLYGLISLTVADVREYIKSPDTYYDFLENRYNRD